MNPNRSCHRVLLNAVSSSPPYVIVLDDHPLIGHGISRYLQVVRPDLPVRVTTKWAQAQQWMIVDGCATVLVADASLANAKAFLQWRGQCRCTPWLSTGDDSEPLLMQQAKSAGAQGFVGKRASPDVFGSAIAAVLAGQEWYEPLAVASQQQPLLYDRTVAAVDLGLTLRQGDVLALVLRGLSNKRIAALLGLSESTVKEHVTGILQRLGVGNRVHAITLMRGRRLTVVGRQAARPVHAFGCAA